MKEKQVQDPDIVSEVIKFLKLRFFTPREVANLMCFPSDYSKYNNKF